MTECLGSLLIVAIVGGVLIYYIRLSRKNGLAVTQVWSELAQKTGLSLEPGKGWFFDLQKAPTVSGQYRGRGLKLTYVVKHTGWLSAFISNLLESQRYIEERLYTETSLRVVNPTNLWLVAGERGASDRLVEKLGTSGAKVELDENYVVECPSADLAEWVGRLLVQRHVLSEPPKELILMLEGSWRTPQIELYGSDLVCRQSGFVTNAEIQIAFLDVFCDLADLVDQRQNEAQPILAPMQPGLALAQAIPGPAQPRPVPGQPIPAPAPDLSHALPSREWSPRRWAWPYSVLLWIVAGAVGGGVGLMSFGCILGTIIVSLVSSNSDAGEGWAWVIVLASMGVPFTLGPLVGFLSGLAGRLYLKRAARQPGEAVLISGGVAFTGAFLASLVLAVVLAAMFAVD